MGKLKTSFWREAAGHYAARLSHWRRLELDDVRDGDAALPPAQRMAQEGRRRLDALAPKDALLAQD